jgi:hypothetical protein
MEIRKLEARTSCGRVEPPAPLAEEGEAEASRHHAARHDGRALESGLLGIGGGVPGEFQ